MERELVLEMKDIEKHFHAVKALKGVSFKLYKGEILAIIGENGAGKSTLMKILSGVYPHSTFTGDILLGNNAVKFSNSKDSQNRGIEMIYQEMSMADNLTVAENIMLGFLPRRKMKPFVDFKAMDKSAGEILKYVGLNIDASEIVRNLSTSQKQLMSIAKAVFKKPKILVLDEPTSALTEKDSARLFDILNNLVKDGISCVYISHKLDEVFSISDRIMVLRDGQTINTYEKRTDEKYDANRIIEDMVGRKIEQMYPKVTVAIGNEVLAIKDITVPSTVHGKKKINRVSFSLREGEILGLGGLVGAGRSELLGALFGAEELEEGEIYINGKEAKINNPMKAIEFGIGFLTEDRKVNGFAANLNNKRNVTLASLERFNSWGFIKGKKESKEAEVYKEKLSIKTRSMEDNTINLSGGNQQKVVLAKWLMRNPRILFLDEPTRGIDVGAKVEIYNLIYQLAGNGVGIVLISSELPEFLALCDRFIILFEGKTTGEFKRSEINEEIFMKAATGLLQT